MLRWFWQRPAWDSTHLTDEWFKSHFEYATAVVHDWLDPYLNWKKARLLDFGCGDGITALGIALRYRPRSVLGIDVLNAFSSLQSLAKQQLQLRMWPSNLSFRQLALGEKLTGTCAVDAVLTWSVFEHVTVAEFPIVVADLFTLLPPGGMLFLQIEPLYYSPFGSHLGRFIKQPWAHLLLDEDTLKTAVLGYDGDIPSIEKEHHFYVRSFTEYKEFIWSEYAKLNQLTADEIIQHFTQQGFGLLREERGQVTIDIPAELVGRYQRNDLLTNELRVLLRKPR